MWYLNAYTIFSLFGVSALLGLLSAFAGSWGERLRRPVILLFSLGFLALYSEKLVVFSAVYVVINYGCYRWILAAAKRWRKPVFAVSIVMNLSVLVVLRLFSGGVLSHPLYASVLTIGLIYTLLKVISTFYHALIVAEKPGPTLTEYASYLLFIPTFTSGPIMKFHEFLKDIRSSFRLTGEALELGVKRIIKGLFKKLVLVSLLLLVYNEMLASELNPGLSAMVLLVFYVMLYFDFSGYSDIAVGFGHLLGIRVPENFKKPFSSPTLTQFWRNWHATLGDWFRDHIFLFWAGKTRFSGAIISFVVMLLVGLWHGFVPLFILWGVYHGVLLFAETMLRQTTVNRRKVSRVSFALRCLGVNVLVAFGTIFFSDSTETALRILQGFAAW